MYKQLHVLLLVLLTGSASGECSIGFTESSVFQTAGAFQKSPAPLTKYYVTCRFQKHPVITRVRMKSEDSGIVLEGKESDDNSDVSVPQSTCFDSGPVNIISDNSYYYWEVFCFSSNEDCTVEMEVDFTCEKPAIDVVFEVIMWIGLVGIFCSCLYEYCYKKNKKKDTEEQDNELSDL